MSMTAATLIKCPECGSTNFYLHDGRHVCQRCNRESRDHGIETTLDEESFGAFGSGAKTHKSRFFIYIYILSHQRVYVFFLIFIPPCIQIHTTSLVDHP